MKINKIKFKCKKCSRNEYRYKEAGKKIVYLERYCWDCKLSNIKVSEKQIRDNLWKKYKLYSLGRHTIADLPECGYFAVEQSIEIKRFYGVPIIKETIGRHIQYLGIYNKYYQKINKYIKTGNRDLLKNVPIDGKHKQLLTYFHKINKKG